MLNEKHIKEIVDNVIKKVIHENYSLTNIDELMEYMWLKPEITKLNVDIFVDDGGSYKRNNHQLCVFARNGYNKNINEFITFSVESNPEILNSEIDYNISYNDIFDIQDFIEYNQFNLQKLANKQISQIDFIKKIRTIRYSMAESNHLNEMATLRSEDSKLPMDIWLDEGATFIGHAPRLKFRASREQRTTREFSSMLLTNPPTIENFPKNSPIKAKDIKKLENFVIKNLDNLLELAKGKIDYTKDFLPNIILD